jgi:cell division cycle 14
MFSSHTAGMLSFLLDTKQNGDLNWIVKDKILAFAGPSFERNVTPEGYCTLAPSDYIPYFQRKNVGLVVRLNKRCYNEQDFVNAGIKHVDAFFLDGSCPPTKVLYKVLEAFENCETAFAVHCKAGLGRTGTCIGAYLMKHYRFTAAEAIGWMRICRPGCVIGPQQHYLKQIEARMWAEGEAEGRHVERSLPSLPNGADVDQADDGVVMMDTTDREAVVGRAGQAEGLLSARGRRGHGASHLDTPLTPEQSSKNSAVAVTPDTASRKAQASQQLWCS